MNDDDSVSWAPRVITKMLSKIRNASRARKRTATMIAARMFGRITLNSRWLAVAPSTLAASSMSSETCDRPARSSSAMNGVVFQISLTMIANIACQWSPYQLVDDEMPGSQSNQEFTHPLLIENVNCQANAETTVMMP